ncbi:MAG: Succinylornithine transaminase, partial [uncultured Lysobacter sp.]
QPHSVQRHRGRARRDHRRCRRRDRRADPGRGRRDPGRPRVPSGAARAVRPDRRAAGVRRSAVGCRPHRRPVCLHGHRRHPGHPDLGQGPGQRLPDRRHADHRGNRHAPQCRLARHHLRRQSAGRHRRPEGGRDHQHPKLPGTRARSQQQDLRQPREARGRVPAGVRQAARPGPPDRPADGGRVQGPLQGLHQALRKARPDAPDRRPGRGAPGPGPGGVGRADRASRPCDARGSRGVHRCL